MPASGLTAGAACGATAGAPARDRSAAAAAGHGRSCWAGTRRRPLRCPTGWVPQRDLRHKHARQTRTRVGQPGGLMGRCSVPAAAGSSGGWRRQRRHPPCSTRQPRLRRRWELNGCAARVHGRAIGPQGDASSGGKVRGGRPAVAPPLWAALQLLRAQNGIVGRQCACPSTRGRRRESILCPTPAAAPGSFQEVLGSSAERENMFACSPRG